MTFKYASSKDIKMGSRSTGRIGSTGTLTSASSGSAPTSSLKWISVRSRLDGSDMAQSAGMLHAHGGETALDVAITH
jgi:hypothetical protein